MDLLFRCLLTKGGDVDRRLFFLDKIDDSHFFFLEDNLNNNKKNTMVQLSFTVKIRLAGDLYEF